MHPILGELQVGERLIPLGTYGACVTLGLVVGALVALHSARRTGLELGGFIAALGAALGAGFAGAGLTFASIEWLSRGQLPAAPGAVFYGGAIAGGLGFAALARVHGLPLAAALDALLPALPLGHALGRLGCLFGGCCYGAAWSGPWAIVYTHPLAPAAHPSLPRHPWPIYEALFLLLLAAVFARPRRARRPGTAAVGYVLAYATGRFALEPLRGDAIRGALGVWSTSQLVSVALVAGALALCLRQRRVYIAGP